MKNWLIGKILGFIGSRLDGYKTVIGGVGLILVGVVGITGKVFPDQGLPQMDIDSAFASIAAGVAALGLGHKAEKVKAVVQAQGDRPSEIPKGPVPTYRPGPLPFDWVKGLRPEEEERAAMEQEQMDIPPDDKGTAPSKWDGKVPGQFPFS